MPQGDLASARPVALIAGNGRLPLQVASALQKNGREFLVIAIKGEADEQTRRAAATELGWGEVGRLHKFLTKNGCHDVILIGGVSKRPDFSSILGDLGTLVRLPRIFRTLTGGDDSLLSKVIRFFEDEGFRVLGIKNVAPELLAASGVLGNIQPKKRDWLDIQLALDATRKLGELDIGQAAISVAGRVVALEGAEGTDAMLERCAELREKGRIRARGSVGVLVKSAKPDQDLRVDLPTVGPRTIELAKLAGLAGIAVEAGGALISDKEQTLLAANKAGLFVIGLEYDAPDLVSST